MLKDTAYAQKSQIILCISSILFNDHLLDLSRLTAVFGNNFIITLIQDVVEVAFDTELDVVGSNFWALGAGVIKTELSRGILASEGTLESEYILVIIKCSAHDRPK